MTVGGVAQVDADDLEPVDPPLSASSVNRRTASRGKRVVDGQVRPVAQEHEGDVHADLGAPPGEQGGGR